MKKNEKKMVMNCHKELRNIVLEAVENENELSSEDLLRVMIQEINSVMTVLKFIGGGSVLNTKG